MTLARPELETVREDRDLYLACLPLWADMYVTGHWSLEKFEAHADAMMPPYTDPPERDQTLT